MGLKDVQLRAHEIRDPNKFVLSNAQWRLTKPKAVMDDKDERDRKRARKGVDDQCEWMKCVSRQVGQLNNFGNFPTSKISYSEVKEPLQNCGFLRAMMILQDLVAANATKQVE